MRPGLHDSNPSSNLRQKKRFLISKDFIIVPTSEKNKQFSEMATIWKKSHFYPLFHSYEFFLNNKKQNFDINQVETIGGYIEKVIEKFQVNMFIRTWDIMSTVLK